MQNYTNLMERKAYEAANEDYPREMILEAVGMFRTFAASLDEFLAEHGYCGEMDDVTGKAHFLKQAFEGAGIAMPRGIRECYAKDKGIGRTAAFQICFAFGLDKEGTDDFFRRVMLAKSFDCHVMEEAVYYFCMQHGMGYGEALRIIQELPKEDVPDVTKSRMSFDGDILFTSAIVKEMEKLQNAEELLAYFRRNAKKFGYNHAGATEEIQKLWRKIREGEMGLANLEKTKIQQCEIRAEEPRSVSEVFLQILGLDETDEENEPLFAIKSDRSIKPLLKDNPLLPKVAEHQFPSRQTIEKILKGEHVEPESIRKTLILSYFYYFWICKAFQSSNGSLQMPISRKNLTVYQARPGDDERFTSDANRRLLEVGYPELYLGNPYDWIFLYCCKSEEPLTVFREFIHEMYLENEEVILRVNAGEIE